MPGEMKPGNNGYDPDKVKMYVERCEVIDDECATIMSEAMSKCKDKRAEIKDILTEAKDRAENLDIYLDGGALIQQALNADLVDELIITLIPVLLGAGTRLFDHLNSSSELQFFGHHPMGNGMLQVHARLVRE